jgi:sensor domain CHASE-containing protein
MILEDVRGLLEDFAFGVLCTATWIQDQGKGWITFGLAVVYGVYKIISQQKITEGNKLDNELKRKQLEQWDQTRTSIEADLATQVRALKNVKITEDAEPK